MPRYEIGRTFTTKVRVPTLAEAHKAMDIAGSVHGAWDIGAAPVPPGVWLVSAVVDTEADGERVIQAWREAFGETD